jgi:hypothetical protein
MAARLARPARRRGTVNPAVAILIALAFFGVLGAGAYGLDVVLRPVIDPYHRQQPSGQYSPPAGTRTHGPPPQGKGHGVHLHLIHVRARGLIYVFRGAGGGRTGGTNSTGTP